MKKVTIAVASLFAAASFAAVAAPVEMSKKELSKVVAGAAPGTLGEGTGTATLARGGVAPTATGLGTATSSATPNVVVTLPAPGAGNVNRPN